MKANLKIHEPVLLKEVLEFLHIKNQGRYIDATLGAGGYSIEIAKKGGSVLAFETDPEMIKVAKKNIDKAFKAGNKKEGEIKIIEANFKDLAKVAKEENFTQVAGIVFDLGVSNVHFSSDSRGFSFNFKEALLDMRLNSSAQSIKASDLLNALREDQLKELFEVVMPYQDSVSLAKAVVRQRTLKRIEKVGDFVEIIKKVVKKFKRGLNEATLAFLALRMAVNSELENLKEGLKGAFSLLKKDGFLVVVSFHSKEDEIVKRFFREREEKSIALILTKKPLEPGELEISQNPKARSGRLRAIKKI